MPDSLVKEDFPQLADPFRRELLAHCYRMVGSAHDAEDLVQETYLRAWRSYEKFEGRSSMRTWLHRIATNTCLDALAARNRRPLPTGLGAPSSNPTDTLVEQPEVPWLEPIADSAAGVGEGDASDPASIVTSRESVRLAFVAALQHLPPRQRAVLLLRDVLRWKASEVAEYMETTVASVNSALQRARAQLERTAPSESSVSEPEDSAQKALLDRYVRAFEAKDIGEIVELFTQDAVWEMPPFTGWYQGPKDIGVLVDTNCPAGPDDMRLVRSEGLNGQPAFGVYMRREPGGAFTPFQVQVLDMVDGAVRHVVAFFEPRVFPQAGLPDVLPPDHPRS